MKDPVLAVTCEKRDVEELLGFWLAGYRGVDRVVPRGVERLLDEMAAPWRRPVRARA